MPLWEVHISQLAVAHWVALHLLVACFHNSRHECSVGTSLCHERDDFKQYFCIRNALNIAYIFYPWFRAVLIIRPLCVLPLRSHARLHHVDASLHRVVLQELHMVLDGEFQLVMIAVLVRLNHHGHGQIWGKNAD